MLTMITYKRKLVDETELNLKEKLTCIAMIWKIDDIILRGGQDTPVLPRQ